eukprot:TRINITY_DN1867_c0_g1_i2.p3 TRINITY_DN1867_c0_g1~~TRINITY_DN1867_c0_g1_i2.p3  ORF type:complete len:130 (-),score=31.34 TRINITY_DN1867_c0_g1_i2:797-1186(-)
MFADDWGCIFILPVEVLNRSHKINVDLTITLETETIHLKWSFSTIAVTDWHVTPDAKNEWTKLAFAARCAIPGDTIRLAPGVHKFTRDTGEVRTFAGAGVDQTTLGFVEPQGDPSAVFMALDPAVLAQT